MINSNDFGNLFDSLDVQVFGSYSEEISNNLYVPDSKSFYELYRTPYFIFILDNILNQTVETISLMCSSQVGKSLLLTAIALETCRRNPGTFVVYCTPNDTDAQSIMNKKLIPCCEQSPVYQSLLVRYGNGDIDRSAMTKKSIKFSNGSEILVQGIGGKTALTGKSCQLVILDEYSRMANRKETGDVLEAARERTKAWSKGNRKVIAASTPLTENETIDKLWKESKQYQWFVPCPHCGKLQYLDFYNLKFPKKPDEDISDWEFADLIGSENYPLTYECPECKGVFGDGKKMSLLNKGKIVNTGNQNLSGKQISLHISGLYSLDSWSNIAGNFIKSKSDPEKLKVFVNSVLAAPWEAATKTSKMQKEMFIRGNYKKNQLPPDTYKIIAGIDVQQDRFYYVLLAVTKSKKIYLIDFGMPEFDVTNPYNPNHLPYELESRLYPGNIGIDKIIIDSGYNTQTVKDIVNSIPKAVAIKGIPTAKFSEQFLIRYPKTDVLGCPLQETNQLLETYIQTQTILFPNDLGNNEEILEHLCNVIKKGNLYKDKQSGVRTDYRDCFRYALAWIKSDKIFDKMDRDIFKETNKENISKTKTDNLAKLNSMFRA